MDEIVENGKHAQYVGRIRREGGPKKVYDYRDANIPVLDKLWKKRATYYRKNSFSFAGVSETPSTLLL